MNLYAFAVAVVAAYFRLEEATRPIDKKVAKAELAGMFKAANRLGLGMTETHIEITFLDHLRHMTDRPHYNAVNNSARKEWDEALARLFADALAGL